MIHWVFIKAYSSPGGTYTVQKREEHKNSIIEPLVFQGLPKDGSGIGVQDRWSRKKKCIGKVCWNPGMMWHAQRCLLYQALKMIIIILLVICYLKPGLVTKTDKLFIHLLLIPWCPKVTGPDKIYGTPLKASDRPLKEGRSSSWKLSLTISCLFKLFPTWHLGSRSEPTSE